MIQDKLKKQRLNLKLSRDKLAKLADVTTQTIFRAETSGKITLQNYLKITSTLDRYGKKLDRLNSVSNSNANSGSDTEAQEVV